MPPAPANLLASPLPSGTQILLTWQDLAGLGFGYRIERALAAAGPWVRIADLQTNATSYQDAGLTPGTTYFYQVASVDLNPVSAPASAFAQTPSGTTTPGKLRFVTPYTPSGAGSQVHTLSVAVTTNGEFVTCGNFVGTVDFGNGPRTAPGGSFAFIARHAASGTLLWVVTFGNNFATALQSVKVGNDGAIVTTGYFAGILNLPGIQTSSRTDQFQRYTNDVIAVKLLPDGTFSWAKSFGSQGSDSGMAITVDVDGSIFLAASIGGAATFGTITVPFAGALDVAVAKLNSAGSVLWARSYGGAGYDIPHGIAVTLLGDVAVTGEVSGPVTIGGTTIPASGQSELFLSLFDGSSGVPLWTFYAASLGRDSGYGVAVDPSTGNIALTGTIGGSVSFGPVNLNSLGLFLALFDPTGRALWAHNYSTSQFDVGYSVAFDQTSGIAFAGQVASLANFGGGTTSGPQSFFVATYDRNGTYRWARRGGSNGNAAAKGVVFDGSGHALIAGDCSGTVDFGGQSVTVQPGETGSFLTDYDA